MRRRRSFRFRHHKMMDNYYSSVVPPGHGKPKSPETGINDSFAFVHILESAFSAEECDRIVGLGLRGQAYPYFSQRSEDGQAGAINVAPENHESHAILHSEESEWLYRKVWGICEEANVRVFSFQIRELSTALVMRTYHPGSAVHWHFDNVRGGEKIGFVLQLTDPAEYDGSSLVAALPSNNAFYRAPRTRGTVILFPTFVCHTVLPLTRGVRRSLVCWAMGDTFR